MKTKVFFELAKANGINDSEIRLSNSTSIDIEYLNGEIDTYNVSESKKITARGIVNGKFGVGITNFDNSDTPSYLVESILSSGKNIEKEEEAIIFEGSKKYVKKSVFNKELSEIPLDEKLKHLHTMNEFIRNYDSRIENVAVSYSESSDVSSIENSYGLKLKTKSNHYFYSAFCTVRNENGEVVNASEYFLENDLSKFDPIVLAKKVTSAAISKLNPIQCKSKQYNVVLKQKVVSSLLSAFISNLSSEDVQKKTSALAGKLNEEIVSKKLTISERPTDNNIFFNGYDSEGVATYNKVLINKGVLKTYLYNLTTAKKDGVQSTGNGYGGVTKIGIDTNHLVIKPGKKSFDQLLAKAKNGVYITAIMGLHAGLNSKSGDFSLQAQGFMIENGVLTKPLSQIVVAGNLFTLFKNVNEVGNDTELLLSSNEVPSLLIKKLQVNGK